MSGEGFIELLLFFALILKLVCSSFVEISPLEYHSFTLSKDLNYNFIYTQNNKEKQSIINFVSYTTSEFWPILICVSFQADFDECVQKEIIDKQGKTLTLIQSEADAYYLRLSSTTGKEITQEIVIYNGEMGEEITFNNPVQVTEYSQKVKKYFHFKKGAFSLTNVSITKKNLDYILKLKLINLSNMKMLLHIESAKDIQRKFADFSEENTTYLLEISSDKEATEINELSLENLEVSLITLKEGKEVINDIKDGDVLFFKVDLKEYSDDEENLITLGFNSGRSLNDTVRISCSVSDSNKEKVLESCKFYEDEGSVQYITFKTPKGLEEDSFVLISSSFQILDDSVNEFEYRTYLSSHIKRVNIQEAKSINITLLEGSPVLTRIDVPTDYFGSLIIYSSEKEILQIIKEELLTSFKTRNHLNTSNLYIYNGDKDEFKSFYVGLFPKNSTKVTLVLNNTKEDISYKIIDESSSHLVQLYSCFKPVYYVFYLKATPQNEYFNFDYTSKAFLRVKTEFSLDGDSFDILPSTEKFIEPTEVIEFKGNLISVEIGCDMSTEIQLVFFNNQNLCIDFGVHYFQFSKSISVHFSFPNNHTSISVENRNKEESFNLTVKNETFKISTYYPTTINHFDQEEADYSFSTDVNSIGILTVITNKENFYILNDHLEWETETISKEANPIAKKILYFLPENRFSWKYLEVYVETYSDFNSYFGYYEKAISTEIGYRYFQVWEDKVKETNDNKFKLILLNPYYFNLSFKQQYYLVLISDQLNFSKIQIKIYNNTEIIGKEIVDDQGVFVINKEPKDTFSFSFQNFTKNKVIFFNVHSCNKREALKFGFNTHYVHDTILTSPLYEEVNSTLPERYPINTIGIYGSVKGEKHSGVLVSYKAFNSDEIFYKRDEIIEMRKYLNYTPSKIFYNQEEKSLFWDKLDNLTYEIYLLEETDEEIEYMENDCFLYKEKQKKETKMLIISTDQNSYSFDPGNNTYVATALAIRQPIMPIRLIYQSEVISIFNYTLLSDYPNFNDPITNPVTVIILNKEKEWDYIEIKITDPGYKYYTKLGNTTNLNTITLPSKINSNLREEKEGYTFTLQNPFLNSTEDIIFYFVIRMTKEPIEKEDSPLGNLSFNYKKNNEFEHIILTPDKAGYYSYLNESFPDAYFRLANTSAPSQQNTISFIVRKCAKGSSIKMTISSFGNLQSSSIISDIYTQYTYSTYTDLFIKFESSESAKAKYGGFDLSILGANISPKAVEQAKDIYSMTDKNLYYSVGERKISWDATDDAEYEIYIIKVSEETKEEIDNIDNDCFRQHLLLQPKKEGITIKRMRKKTYVSFTDIGDYIAAVSIKLRKPFGIRIPYKALKFHAPKYQYISLDESSEIKISWPNNYALVNLSSNANTYYSLRASLVNAKHYISFGFSTEKDFDKIPLPEVNNDTEKNSTYSLTIQTPNNTVNEGYYYLAFLFTDKLIKYHYFNLYCNYDILTEKNDTQLKIDENGIYYFDNNFQEDKSKETKTFLKFYDKINHNIPNNITFITRSCTNKTQFGAFSGALSLFYVYQSQTNQTQIFSFETYSDLQLTLKSDNSSYSGFTFSYGVNKTDNDLKTINKYLSKGDNLGEIKYEKSENLIKWEAFDNFTYEVYIFPSKEISPELIENDCYLNSLKESRANKSSFVSGKTKDNSYHFNLTGEYYAFVFALTEEPISLKFKYKPLKITSFSTKFLIVVFGVMLSLFVIVFIFAAIMFTKKTKRKQSTLGEEENVGKLIEE